MNTKAIHRLQRGLALVVETAYGPVDLSSSSDVWGSGPNVTGLQWARQQQTPLTHGEGQHLFSTRSWPAIQEMCEEWAFFRAEDEAAQADYFPRRRAFRCATAARFARKKVSVMS